MGKKKKKDKPEFRPAPENIPGRVLIHAEEIAVNPELQKEQNPISHAAFEAAWKRVKAETDRRLIQITFDPPYTQVIQLAIGLAGFALIQQSIYDLHDPTLSLEMIKHRSDLGKNLVNEFTEWTWDARYRED